MPAVPPTTTHYHLPRYDGLAPADFPGQYNAGIDAVDAAIWGVQPIMGAWTALALNAGWANPPVPYDPLMYRKDPFGYVEFRGGVQLPAPGAAFGSPVGVLPGGFRPVVLHEVPVTGFDTSGSAPLYLPTAKVNTSGELHLGITIDSSHTNVWLLSGLRFPTT